MSARRRSRGGAAAPPATRPDGSPWPEAPWHRIESLDLEAQGIAHADDGKVLFVEGALPGEQAQVALGRSKARWAQATVTAVRRPSALRVTPRCPHFGLHAGACGGCKAQHIDAGAQVAFKQRVLEDSLERLARVRPGRVLAPIAGPDWGYRHRARLSVRHVPKKGTVLVGFHERKSRYVADMRQCEVLPTPVSALLVPLRELVGSMDARDRLPQIELALGHGAEAVMALVLRHLEPLSAQDIERLHAFAARHAEARIQWWLQPGGPDTARLLEGGALTTVPLAYHLPEFGVAMPYRPTDFTQVNPAINEVLVRQALGLLAPQPGQRVIDWFCGLGNFTLPIARRVGAAGAVLGIEGSAALVERARGNAAVNGLAARSSFEVRNLFELNADDLRAQQAVFGPADLWLVDPPREGAFALVKALVLALGARLGSHGGTPAVDDAAVADEGVADEADDLASSDGEPAAADAPVAATPGGSPATHDTGFTPPRRIVYVSCNPATLARDAGILVHLGGYRLSAAGIVNMFPHTAHVESMAVFDLPPMAAETDG